MTAAPLTAAQIRAVPLRCLTGPPPGRAVAEVVPAPSRALAAAWGSSGLVYCPVDGCGAPIRPRVWDTIGAVLGDVDPVPAEADCLWHGPAGIDRAWGAP